MSLSKHILVIRFSAMGDVAMTVPVIKNALDQNAGLTITVVSNAFFAPLFAGLERCRFHPAHLKTIHKGATGIYELFRELLTQNKFDGIADLHAVLRSSLLKTFFRLSGHSTATIDKGRKEKKQLTRKENKVLQPLASTHERYAQVFRALGARVTLDDSKPVFTKQAIPQMAQHLFQPRKKIVGVAPFAQHKEKMYPPEKMKLVIKTLAIDHTVLLFGGGITETALLQEWANEIPSVYNMAGKCSFSDELAVISNLDVMVSMDSANMHLASLYKIPVISIWGATHPFAGFYGWGQDESNIVSIDLACRPCSVFGNKPCWRGDHACMERISDTMILEKLP